MGVVLRVQTASLLWLLLGKTGNQNWVLASCTLKLNQMKSFIYYLQPKMKESVGLNLCVRGLV